MSTDAIELEAESGVDVFSEMELKNIWLGIDIRETRQVLVTGKVRHMEVFDVMPSIVDGSIYNALSFLLILNELFYYFFFE